ncbi:CDK5 regulatory subunit-associated protein 3 [Gouania willdenowi]|uniref:CDK5 regulatory subunit-associated protein 3 n=1 Tax=Gouania willdenowi TaxID=441366 RepID=UPI0010543839|nr:CDK5 regulatory subunit-associated protein 3 [Gouania willdenowi]
MENIQNLPIDIQTSKLMDWLVDRRHCNLKWQNSVKVIRGKINSAIQDMPENEEIKRLLSGSYIHYFHCLRIVELLKGTEASSKNIFGRYSSQRMKDWQEIVSLYEEDNVYLAEVSSLLCRNVSYEGPALRKQLIKAQQLQQELSRRETESHRSASELRERYYASCRQYGITGENVAQELQGLVKDLPGVLDEICRDAAKLEEQIQLYAAFTHFLCDWSEPVLPLLTFAQRKGNVTFYEWKHGEAPTSVERPTVEKQAEPLTEGTIDWGDFGKDSDAVDEGIDWGISVEPNAEDSGGGDVIDWGDTDAVPVEIEVVDVGADCSDRVARGDDALSLLGNSESRSQFIDELLELEAFLTHRAKESGEQGDVVSMSMFQLAPSVIQAQSVQHVHVMLSHVQDLLSRLTNLRMQHLFMILASPGYVERVSDMLRQKMKQADMLLLKASSMAQRRQEALEEQSRLEPRVDLLAGCTRELQKLIEADISQRYHNRPVNLMGVNV